MPKLEEGYQVLSTSPDVPITPEEPVRIEQLTVDEDKIAPESTRGDDLAWYAAATAAFAIAITSCTLVILNDPWDLFWVSAHMFLNPIAFVLFALSIVTLQPTSQPATKAAGLTRHQRGTIPALVIITIGTSSIIAHKFIYGKRHFHSWHGTIGAIVFAWLIAQFTLGGASVWFGGALFGGGTKAKLVWKYHRLSGYLLLPLLCFTIVLGGTSHWMRDHAPIWLRFLIYSVGSAIVFAGAIARVRPSKMRFS